MVKAIWYLGMQTFFTFIFFLIHINIIWYAVSVINKENTKYENKKKLYLYLKYYPWAILLYNILILFSEVKCWKSINLTFSNIICHTHITHNLTSYIPRWGKHRIKVLLRKTALTKRLDFWSNTHIIWSTTSSGIV